MDGLLRTWNALTPAKRVVLGLVTVATILVVMLVAREANRDPMALLYSGLEQPAAGEVVAALDAQGVASEVRGASIYVPSSTRDRVRMDLAAQGLPAKGQDGYELLDKLSGFGTTSEMFDAAYWRAKEGELARTILAVPGIKQARVHIASASRKAFTRGAAQATASVTVKATGGVDAGTAMSVRYLVALAVAGLEPRQVAVIDADNGLVLKPGDDNPMTSGYGAGEKRAAALKSEIEGLLYARVGPDAARVTVSVETSRDSETLSERLIDPESRVQRSAETSELSEQNKGGGGAVTVASNLPDGDAAANGDQKESNREEASENVVYDFSETRRETVTLAGAVSRIGVAILVDGVSATDAAGETTWAPRSVEELAALEQLVKSAIGFNEARGDSVTIESLQFVASAKEGVEATASPMMDILAANFVTLIQLAILALVALVLALFVVRPILRSGAETAQAAIDAELESQRLAIEAEKARELPAPEEPKNVGASVDRLKLTITEHGDESRALLQRWLEDGGEKAA